MWQRIQTVFLAVAVVALLASMVFPIWIHEGNDEQTRLMSFYLVKSSSSVSDNGDQSSLEQFTPMPYALTAMLCAASITLAIMGIVKYKNRITQMKIGALNSFFLVGVILASFYFSNDLMKSMPGGTGGYGLGMWLPGIAVLCNLLANRFIRKDEKLVRDSNRLR
jgi:hypothetical protein